MVFTGSCPCSTGLDFGLSSEDTGYWCAGSAPNGSEGQRGAEAGAGQPVGPTAPSGRMAWGGGPLVPLHQLVNGRLFSRKECGLELGPCLLPSTFSGWGKGTSAGRSALSTQEEGSLQSRGVETLVVHDSIHD